MKTIPDSIFIDFFEKKIGTQETQTSLTQDFNRQYGKQGYYTSQATISRKLRALEYTYDKQKRLCHATLADIEPLNYYINPPVVVIPLKNKEQRAVIKKRLLKCNYKDEILAIGTTAHAIVIYSTDYKIAEKIQGEIFKAQQSAEN